MVRAVPVCLQKCLVGVRTCIFSITLRFLAHLEPSLRPLNQIYTSVTHCLVGICPGLNMTPKLGRCDGLCLFGTPLNVARRVSNLLITKGFLPSPSPPGLKSPSY